MIICTTWKRRKLNPWHLIYGSVQIKEATEVNLLGVNTQNLSWMAHITDLFKSVIKMAGMIRRIAKFWSKDVLKVISYSLIYSHINYCCAVLGNATHGYMRRLQITLNKAARMVLKCRSEKGMSELHIIMVQWTVAEYLNIGRTFYCTHIKKFKSLKS